MAQTPRSSTVRPFTSPMMDRKKLEESIAHRDQGVGPYPIHTLVILTGLDGIEGKEYQEKISKKKISIGSQLPLDECGGLDPKTTASPTCMQCTRQGPLLNTIGSSLTDQASQAGPGFVLSLAIWGRKEFFSSLHILRDRWDWDSLSPPPLCVTHGIGRDRDGGSISVHVQSDL